MSVKAVIYYTITCDRCGVDAFKDDETTAWNEPEGALMTLGDAEWLITDEGGHYCTDCTVWDDEADTWVPDQADEGVPDGGVPFVAIGFGEEPPWGDDRSCPACGEPNLPLADSDPPGLHFIEHCGQAWIRGPIDLPRTREISND